MSGVGLFLVGAAVTIVVGIALALCIWGAILDGREVNARRLADERERARRRPSTTPQVTST